MDCLFCSISTKQLTTDFVYEDDEVMAFNDINPQAPWHILIVPKAHIATTNDIKDEQQILVGKLIQTAAKIAEQLGFAEAGYRTVFNCNEDGGQTVGHIHLHLLAGQPLGWPPFANAEQKQA